MAILEGRSWKRRFSKDLVPYANFIQECINNDDEERQQHISIPVLIGNSDCPDETMIAIEALRIAKQLHASLMRFNEPVENITSQRLRELQLTIFIDHQKWKDLHTQTPVYEWFCPSNDICKSICMYENKTSIAGIYRSRHIPNTWETEFREACIDGNLTLAKWIYSHMKVDPHMFRDQPFRIACHHNQVSIAKWLYYDIGDVNPSSYDNSAFCLSCTKGHLESIQFLTDIIPNIQNQIDIHYIFYRTSRNGHLYIMKFLYEKYNIDHTNDEGCAFWMALANDKTNVAEWIYSLGGIDLESRWHIDHTFRYIKNTPRYMKMLHWVVMKQLMERFSQLDTTKDST